MHKYRYLALLLLFLVYFALAPPPAHATGLVTFTCPHTAFAQTDVIVASGQPVSNHLHDFQANTGASNYLATLSSLKSSTTSCTVAKDRDAMWRPALMKNGQPVAPVTATYYLANDRVDDVQIPPDGLRWVTGDHDNTNPSLSPGFWQCAGGSVLYKVIPPAGTCGANDLKLALYAGNGCWDGVNVGPGLGQNTGPANGRDHMTGSPDCAGRVRVPRVNISARWPSTATGGTLSSDNPGSPPGSSLHSDFVFVDNTDVFGRSFLHQIVDQCLNYVDYDTGGKAPATSCVEKPDGTVQRVSDKMTVFGP